MQRFCVAYRSKQSQQNPIQMFFPGIVLPESRKRSVTTTRLVFREFELTGSELEAMLEVIPVGERYLVKSPKDIVGLYLKFNLWREDAGFEIIRVTEVPEAAAHQPTAPADEWYRTRKVPDHGENCSCPMHRPGNPQLSDPWARGY